MQNSLLEKLKLDITQEQLAQNLVFNPTKDQIGFGSYGSVYRSYDHQLNKFIALKIIRALEPKQIQKIEEEIISLTKLRIYEEQCPYIIKLYYWFNIQNNYYLCLELCQYPLSLSEYIHQQTEFMEIQAIKIFIQVCEGFLAIHRQNIVHRDIKPENILYDYFNQQIRIIDLGSSKIVNPSNNRLSSYVGSPSYMSPQTYQHESYHAYANDIWGLGLLFYKMLAKGRIYQDNSEWNKIVNVIRENQNKIKKEKLPKNITVQSQTILCLCLQIDQCMRPNIQDLVEYLSKHPLLNKKLQDVENLNFYQIIEKIFEKLQSLQQMTALACDGNQLLYRLLSYYSLIVLNFTQYISEILVMTSIQYVSNSGQSMKLNQIQQKMRQFLQKSLSDEEIYNGIKPMQNLIRNLENARQVGIKRCLHVIENKSEEEMNEYMQIIEQNIINIIKSLIKEEYQLLDVEGFISIFQLLSSNIDENLKVENVLNNGIKEILQELSILINRLIL